MAFIYKIHQEADIVRALIANTEINYEIYKHATDYYDEYEALHLMKELFVAPFCFVENYKRDFWNKHMGYLVFTTMVPWKNDIHQHVVDEMEHRRRPCVPDLCDNVEDFLYNHTRWNESNLYCFTKDGCYPTVKDIKGNDLYKKAVDVTCGAVKGWALSEEKWRPYYEHGLDHYKIKFTPEIDDFIEFKSVQVPLKKPNKITKQNSRSDTVIPDENCLSTPVKRSSYFQI